MLTRSLVPSLLVLAAAPLDAQDVRLARVLDEVEVVEPAPGFADLGFGESVGLDGDHLLVGAPRDPDFITPVPVPGAIQVFERVNGSYSFRKRIVPSTSQPDDWFGNRMVVRKGLLYAGTRDRVFVFARDEDGTGEWGEVASLPLPLSFAVDSTGEFLAIADGLSVTLHERNLGGSDAFGVSAVIPMPTSPRNYNFGLGIAIEGDVLVVVSPDDFIHPYSWFVFFFERDLGGPNSWGSSHVLPEGSSYGDWYLGLFLALDDEFAWIEDLLTRYEYDRGTPGGWTLVEQVDYCRDVRCGYLDLTDALAHRDGLFARSYTRADYVPFTDPCGVEVYRRTTSTSGAPGIALVGEVPLSPRHWSFGAAIDVQGDQVVVGAPETNGPTGVVHVFELEDGFAAPAPAPTPR